MQQIMSSTTSTTKVSQVSNANDTPLDSMLFYFILLCHHCETWTNEPVCQAPGRESFTAGEIASQVDVRNSLIDFQCFGKGLWTKTMSN